MIWVTQRRRKSGSAAAGVGHRALEGSGQAHPCISLNVVTESKESGAVAPNRLVLGSLTPAYQKVLERNPGGGVGWGQWCS
jgi:hypothetical protein